MRLDNQTRKDFQKASESIQGCSDALVRSISDNSWPLVEDVAISLTEKVGGLHKAVSDVLATPQDVDVDTSRLREAAVSLRKFIPELKAANLTAAVGYMAQANGRDKDEEAHWLEHQNSNKVIYIAGFLRWIEDGLNSKESGVGVSRT